MTKDKRPQIILHVNTMDDPHFDRCVEIATKLKGRFHVCAARTTAEIIATKSSRPTLNTFTHFINGDTHDEIFENHSIQGRAKIVFTDSAALAHAAGTRNIPLVTFNPELCGLVTKFHLVTSPDAAVTEISRMARAPQLLEEAQLIVSERTDTRPHGGWQWNMGIPTPVGTN